MRRILQSEQELIFPSGARCALLDERRARPRENFGPESPTPLGLCPRRVPR